MATRTAPRAFRAVPLVLGSVIALVALTLLAAGAVALWAHGTQRDAGGYLTTPTELFATPTNAVVSETAQIDVGTPAWFFAPERFGTIRVHAEGPHGLPIFVGIAPAEDVEGYLAGVRHDEIADVGYAPFSVDYVRREGGAPATPPAEEAFWAASAQSTGEQIVTWRPVAGEWRIVALNPDGSAGVEAYVRFGARMAFLGTVAWTLLGVGAALLLLGSALIYAGAKPASGPPHAARPAPPPRATPPAPVREPVSAGADGKERA